MRLLVEELKEGMDLYQTMTYNLNDRVQLAGVYPYLFMKNAPPGDFFFEISRNDGAFSYTKEFTSADIQTALETTDDNAHLFFPVVPEYPIYLEKGTYSLYLYAENYVYTRDSFIGWIRQHEHLNNETSDVPSNDAENPLAFRLKVLREGSKW